MNINTMDSATGFSKVWQSGSVTSTYNMLNHPYNLGRATMTFSNLLVLRFFREQCPAVMKGRCESNV